MKRISQRLWDAVVKVTALRHPSVAQILRKRGFGYEADMIDELMAAFDEANKQTESTDTGQPGAHKRQPRTSGGEKK